MGNPNERKEREKGKGKAAAAAAKTETEGNKAGEEADEEAMGSSNGACAIIRFLVLRQQQQQHTPRCSPNRRHKLH